MKTVVIGAGSDLGVHIDGAHLGPVQLMNDLKSFYQGEQTLLIQDESILKSRNLSDRRKNEYEVDKYNTALYNMTLEKMKADFFPILIGGDHSVSAASALASAKVHENIGVIWFDSHTDYHTFESTVNGNLNGLTLAAITGYKNHELRYFHDGNIIQTSKAVVVGARGIDDAEKDNLKYAGITVFTDQDIKEKGLEAIVEEAFQIATERTKGVHVSFSLDLLDPDIAPGVSTPEFDGISEEEALEINKLILKHMDKIVSYDLVEFNPLRDKERKTEQIALNLLAQIINGVENKYKAPKF